MEDKFVELIVPKKPTALDAAKKGAVIAGILLCAAVGILFFPPALILAVILGFVGSWLWKRFNVEYEYSYVNGQLDVARVFSKQSRKDVAKIDLSEAECIAPQGSHELDSFGSTYKVVDYSASLPEMKPYVIVRGGTKNEKILVQMNEEMLNDLKRRFPRKVFLY